MFNALNSMLFWGACVFDLPVDNNAVAQACLFNAYTELSDSRLRVLLLFCCYFLGAKSVANIFLCDCILNLLHFSVPTTTMMWG